MSQLPANWVSTPIGSLCSLRNGRAFKPTEWVKVGLPIVRIQNLNSKDSSFNYFDGEYSNNYYLRGGELLFAWSGTPGTSFGAHVWKGASAVLNQHIFRVDFDENTLDKRFFRYAINQKLNELIGIAQGGVGLRHITKGKFESTEISLPPFNEQERIADKVDTLLAAVDTCSARLSKIAILIKRFRQSVLAAAMLGDLTEIWRLNRQLNGTEIRSDLNWNEYPLAALCVKDRVITYGVIKLGDEVANGVPCLRTSNVRWLHIDTEGMKRIAPTLSTEYSRTVLKGGEVLVNVRGTLGGVAVVSSEMAGWNVSREVAVVPLDVSRVDSRFLAYWIGSDVSQRWLGRVEKGVAYTGINLEDLRNIPVSLPSMEEQREVVNRVEAMFAVADKLEASLATARKRVDQLTTAILAQAFRGELVEQDPNDEPASALLGRITARSDAFAPRRTIRKAA